MSCKNNSPHGHPAVTGYCRFRVVAAVRDHGPLPDTAWFRIQPRSATDVKDFAPLSFRAFYMMIKSVVGSWKALHPLPRRRLSTAFKWNVQVDCCHASPGTFSRAGSLSKSKSLSGSKSFLP
jgi:hypothetical protein